MEIFERVRELSLQIGLKNVDLSNIFHVSDGYVSEFMRGKKKFSYEKVSEFCDYIGISISEFFSPFGEREKHPIQLQHLIKKCDKLSNDDILLLESFADRLLDKPVNTQATTYVSGAAAAGLPLRDAADPDASIAVPSKYCDSSRYLIFQARGDSMEPRIPNGSYVVCQRDNPPEDGAIAVVRVSSNGDDEYAIKRFYRRGDQVELRSINPAHAPMFYAASEVLSADRVVAYLSPSASPQIR